MTGQQHTTSANDTLDPKGECAHARQNEQQSSVIYLIRHGQGEHNLIDESCDFLQCRDKSFFDPALTKLGLEQAKEASATLSDLLKKSGDEQVNVVVTSTMRRALQTAELATGPLVLGGTPRLAWELASEVQNGDIWNEPPDCELVSEDWPHWHVEGERHLCNNPRFLEGHNDQVMRCEKLWRRLQQLQVPVIVLVAHSGILYWLQRRMSLATESSCSVDSFKTAEVRRCVLPPYDGKQLDIAALHNSNTPQAELTYFQRRQKCCDIINKARRTGSAEPLWSAVEWRTREGVSRLTEKDLES